MCSDDPAKFKSGGGGYGRPATKKLNPRRLYLFSVRNRLLVINLRTHMSTPFGMFTTDVLARMSNNLDPKTWICLGRSCKAFQEATSGISVSRGRFDIRVGSVDFLYNNDRRPTCILVVKFRGFSIFSGDRYTDYGSITLTHENYFGYDHFKIGVFEIGMGFCGCCSHCVAGLPERCTDKQFIGIRDAIIDFDDKKPADFIVPSYNKHILEGVRRVLNNRPLPLLGSDFEAIMKDPSELLRMSERMRGI